MEICKDILGMERETGHRKGTKGRVREYRGLRGRERQRKRQRKRKMEREIEKENEELREGRKKGARK